MIKAVNCIKKFDEKVAVNNLNLTIPNASVFGLVGTNGSGKSTFLRMISGVYTPDKGNIKVDEENVFDNVSAKQKVFFVSDDMYFLPQSTIENTAQLYCEIYPNWSWEKFESLCEKFPINKKTKIKNFSKGMKRQGAIILALSCQPEYLLLDEAFDGLDPVIRVAVRKLIAEEVATRQMTVIISSHNLRELEDFCDQVAIIHYGKLVMTQEIDLLNQQFCKVQFATKQEVAVENFPQKEVLSFAQNGSVTTLVAALSAQEMEKLITPLQPSFIDYIPITLEEVFVYEMEAIGYDTSKILF